MGLPLPLAHGPGGVLVFLFFFFFGMQDLNSPTRDRIHTPCSGSLSRWTAREVQCLSISVEIFSVFAQFHETQHETTEL